MKIGGGEWIWILVIVILLFGAKKLPDLARSLGASAKEFRKGIDDGAKEESKEPSKEPEGNSAP